MEGKDTVKAVTVGGVACTEAAVLDGSYAIQRPFVLVTKDGTTLSPVAQAFFVFATSKDAASLIQNAGDRASPPSKNESGGPHLLRRGEGASRHRERRTLWNGQQAKASAPAGPCEQAIHLIFLLCGIVAVGFVLCISVYLGDLRSAGYPGDRTDQIPLRQGVGAYQRHHGPAIRHSALPPHLCLRHAGSAAAGGAGGPDDRHLSGQSGPAPSGGGDPHGGCSAGRHPVGGGTDLVGMIVLVPAIRRAFGLGSGACLLAAILVLTVMVLPSIINVAETALQAVPREYEEASLALGATETETYFRVSLPARPQRAWRRRVVLGVGRAIGEAMAIIMVAGNVANMPGLFTSVRFLTTGIISGMSDAAVGSLYQQALFSIGLVLFLFIMLINVLLNVCIKRKKED